MAGETDFLGTLSSSLGGAAGIAQAGLGIIQGIGGLIGQGKARREMARLQSQRKAYKTADETYQILQATQANASQGLGSDMLAYLTGNNDRSLSSGISASTLLGGNANDLGNLLDRYSQQSMGIAAQDQAAQMAKFSQYLNAVSTLGASKDAEWQSQENILKDKIQAASARSGDATKGLQSGVNAVLGSISAGQQQKLYNNQSDSLSSLMQYLGSGNASNMLPAFSAPRNIAPPTLING